MPEGKKYLYTYLPNRNDADERGILATALAPAESGSRKGWKKYKDRAARFGYATDKEGVLQWLDDSVPGLRRSYAVSALSEPIADDASPQLIRFRRKHRLYRIDPARALLAAGVIKSIYRTHDEGTPGAFRVEDTSDKPIDWSLSKDTDAYYFSRIPHYFLETTKGSIPPKYIEEQ